MAVFLKCFSYLLPGLWFFFPVGIQKFYESFRQKYYSLIRDALTRIERAIEMLNSKENEPSYTLDVGWGSG